MAKEIRTERLRKEYDADDRTVVANDDIDLTIEEGEFTTIVGPSGCGKTTLLRMIAGLQEPTSGRLYFGDEDVTDERPQDRDISMVFQNIALYPHMTVRENIGYALKIEGVPNEERAERVEEAAEILQIADQLEKKPDALSGGQQQRVALGAAFVKEPEIILFDEPMSDLDAKLRAELRVEVQQLHKRLDATVVYVTHDQTEAMTMSDTVVTLREGHVEQVAPPTELFDFPNSTYVAEFIGTPATNFLPVDLQLTDGTPTLRGFGMEIEVPSEELEPHAGRTVDLGVRPQYLSAGGGSFELDVTINVIEPLGTESVVHATRPDGEPIDFVTDDIAEIFPGDTVTVGFDEEDLIVFGPDGEAVVYGARLFDSAGATQQIN
jgi:multiple sugar transport system ATP-binding protein